MITLYIQRTQDIHPINQATYTALHTHAYETSHHGLNNDERQLQERIMQIECLIISPCTGNQDTLYALIRQVYPSHMPSNQTTSSFN